MLSPRPELIVGLTAPVVDPQGAQIGMPGPSGRERVLTALPLNKDGPRQLEGGLVIAAVDPSGSLVGENDSVWVSRMLTAERTEDTRS